MLGYNDTEAREERATRAKRSGRDWDDNIRIALKGSEPQLVKAPIRKIGRGGTYELAGRDMIFTCITATSPSIAGRPSSSTVM